MFSGKRSMFTGAVLISAAFAIEPAIGEERGPQSFEITEGQAPATPFESFEKQGFEITYRNREGKEISREEFERHGKEQPVAMRVDGDAKTVEITLDGTLPELQLPLTISPGSTLPIRDLRGLAGVSHSWPRADGKYTVIDFYFSGCGPCIQAIPELNAFKQARPDVAVLAITFDDPEETRRFIAERKLAWDVVPDARDFIDKLGVMVYPTVMLVDAKGRLIAVREVADSKVEANGESLEAWVQRTVADARH